MPNYSINNSDFKASRGIYSNFQSNKYTLLKKIASSQSSEIFKALNNNTQQIVAIKFLRLTQVKSEKERQHSISRFIQETLLCSQLQHPNIVRLLDKGTCNEGMYAVFEFVEGKPLSELLIESKSRMALAVAEMMSQVLDALMHIHQMGIVHRDIKPANIMVRKFNLHWHATILDFGIGEFTNQYTIDESQPFTLSRGVLGTPNYCAPEQLRGEHTGPQTDLYAWGLVMLECLTGVQAITGDNISEVINSQLNPRPVPLPTELSGQPIGSLLERVLRKDPSKRPQNTQEVYRLFTKLNFAGLERKAPSLHTSSFNTYTTQNVKDTQKIPTHLLQELAEQKQITVLCLALDTQIITQSLSKQIADKVETSFAHFQSIFSQCIDLIVYRGGFHAGTLGNTALFYFGYPNVTDDDCYLCARTALEVIAYIEMQNQHIHDGLQFMHKANIGIHSGLVNISGTNSPEGETPNTAITITREANSNQIICTDTSYRMLQHFFRFKKLKQATLGFNNKTMTLYRVVGKRSIETRKNTINTRVSRYFVGREQELKHLLSTLDPQNKVSQKKQCIHIVGEAGVGKSRLIFELSKRISFFRKLSIRCLPEYKSQTLHPIICLIKLKYSLNTLNDHLAITTLQDLLFRQTQHEAKLATTIVCHCLGYVIPIEDTMPSLSTHQNKKVLYDSLLFLLFLHEDTNSKCLYIIEDMHSADPTSIEFLCVIVQSPLFQNSDDGLIISTRQILPLKSAVQKIELMKIAAFTLQETKQFVSQIFNGHEVTNVVSMLIFERSEGLPLFIIKLADMFKSQNLILVRNSKVYLHNIQNVMNIPNTLQNALQQHLDNLQCAKKLIQLASVIGQEFDITLLKISSGEDEPELQIMLDELLQKELIEVHQIHSKSIGRFIHPMLCEVAYFSIPSAIRRETHKNIARLLEASGKENSLSLALHWAKAGKYDA